MEKRNKRMVILVGAAVALAVLVGALLLFVGGSGSPETATIRYLTALFHFDYEGMNRYSAIHFEKAVEEACRANGRSGQKLADMLHEEYGVKTAKALFTRQGRELTRNWQEEFGRDYKVTFRVTETAPLSGAEMWDAFEDLKRWYFKSLDAVVRPDKITEMVEIEVEASISGSLGADTDEITIMAVKIDGKWRVLDVEIMLSLISYA